MPFEPTSIVVSDGNPVIVPTQGEAVIGFYVTATPGGSLFVDGIAGDGTSAQTGLEIHSEGNDGGIVTFITGTGFFSLDNVSYPYIRFRLAAAATGTPTIWVEGITPSSRVNGPYRIQSITSSTLAANATENFTARNSHCKGIRVTLEVSAVAVGPVPWPTMNLYNPLTQGNDLLASFTPAGNIAAPDFRSWLIYPSAITGGFDDAVDRIALPLNPIIELVWAGLGAGVTVTRRVETGFLP